MNNIRGYMNTTILTYNRLLTATIQLYADGNCRRERPYEYRTRETINKMACFCPDTDWDLVSQLYEETHNTSFDRHAKLFVSSECKTARDTFRNSGYSITRDPEKADAIIVPDVRGEFYHSMSCDMVAMDTEKGELYLFDIEKPGYIKTELNVNDLAIVRNFVKNTLGLEPEVTSRSKIKVTFISKCKELEDVMHGNMLKIPYCQESKVPLDTPTKFCPETLVFWENIDDMNLLVRTICTSDWMEYPVTLLAFLACFKGGQNWYAYANNDFRRILKQVGYEGYWNLNYIFSDDKYISAKDYGMLQSYILYKLGVDEKGGFVSAKTFEKKIPVELRRIFRRMTAVKPVQIPTRMKFGALEQFVSSN